MVFYRFLPRASYHPTDHGQDFAPRFDNCLATWNTHARIVSPLPALMNFTTRPAPWWSLCSSPEKPGRPTAERPGCSSDVRLVEDVHGAVAEAV